MSSVRFATVSQSPRMVRTTGLPAAMDAWTAVFALRFKAYSSGFTRFCAMVSGANFVDLLITSDTLWVEREQSGSYGNNQIWTDGYPGWTLLAISAGSGAGNVRTYYQRAGGSFTVGPTVDGVTGVPGSFNFQVWGPDGQDNATIDYSLIGVWEVAKSQAEVQSIFGDGRDLVDLTSDWFFNDCTVAADVDDDQSGNSHPLTLTGTPTLVDGDFWNPGVIVVGTAQGGAAATTSTTITIPTVAVDDVLFVAATNRDATAAVSVTDNDSGTWSRVDSGADGLSGWYRRATSATSAKTITVSGATGSLATALTVFRNCTTSGNPFENVSKESNASGDESHAAITPGQNGSFCCLVVGNRNDDLTNVITTPAGASLGAMALLVSRGSTGGNDCYVAIAGALQDTAASTGSITWAQTNSTTVSMVFDLIPDTGLPTIAGAGATAAPAQTLASAGNVLVSGTAATAAASQVLASIGDVALTGSGASTAAVQALAAAGDVIVSGSMATVAAAQILASSGDTILTGTAATTAAVQALASSGDVLVSGTAATAAAAQVLAGQGGDAVVISGSASTTAPGQLLAATGDVLVSGLGTSSASAQALSATGGALVAGAGASVAAAQVLAAVGDAVLSSAVVTTAAPQVLASTGTVLVSGAAASQAPAQVLAVAAGDVLVSGTAASVAAAQRLSAVGADVITDIDESWPTIGAWPLEKSYPEELSNPTGEDWP